LFFIDKITPTWDYSPENDSVIFELNESRHQRSSSEVNLIGSENKYFSIEYCYSLGFSSETIRHSQQFEGEVS
jgi:hypothetical protein